MILTFSCISVILVFIYKSKQLNVLYNVKRASGASIYSTCKYLLDLLVYVTFVRRFNKYKSNVVIYRKYYEVPYRLPTGESYVMKLRRVKRGPTRKTVTVYDYGTDITKVLKKYLGPNNDFHGLKYTPSLLGYKYLTIKVETGDSYVLFNYKENDTIIYS